MKKSTNILLWSLVVIYALTSLGPSLVPALRHPVDVGIRVCALFVFAIVHGSIRYGRRGIFIFVAVCLVVSNISENCSIMTGFPFGHYYYTSVLGPKLFLVPLLIGLGYFGTGYLAWTVANIFLDLADSRRDLVSLIGLPVASAFVMAGWDSCLDPTNATVDKQWIWQNGGGYFGVPYGNFLGWLLTVYVFYQIFALYVSRNPVVVHAERDPKYWYQAPLFLLLIALRFPADYLTGVNRTITDATGHVWQTGDIYETGAVVSLFTLTFASVLGLLKVSQMKQSIGQQRR
jgi:uncharacterized membrane protein